MAWFEALLEEQDVDIMAWAMGTAPVPERLAGPDDATRCRRSIIMPRDRDERARSSAHPDGARRR